MLYFVNRIVPTGLGKHLESSVKRGGFTSKESAEKAAKKHKPCFIRDQDRNIVGQTFNRELPFYV